MHLQCRLSNAQTVFSPLPPCCCCCPTPLDNAWMNLQKKKRNEENQRDWAGSAVFSVVNFNFWQTCGAFLFLFSLCFRLFSSATSLCFSASSSTCGIWLCLALARAQPGSAVGPACWDSIFSLPRNAEWVQKGDLGKGWSSEQGEEGGAAGHHQICRQANVLTKNAVKFSSSSWAAFAFPSSLASLTLCLLCLSRLERDCAPLMVPPLGCAPALWIACELVSMSLSLSASMTPLPGWTAGSLLLTLSLSFSGQLRQYKFFLTFSCSPPLFLFLSCCHCWHSQVFYHICKCEFYARREQNTSYTPYIYRICWYYLHKWWTSWLPY